jgi:hypothetical protein
LRRRLTKQPSSTSNKGAISRGTRSGSSIKPIAIGFAWLEGA